MNRRKNGKEGFALGVVLVFVTLMTLMGTAILALAVTNARMAPLTRRIDDQHFAAESVLHVAMQMFAAEVQGKLMAMTGDPFHPDYNHTFVIDLDNISQSERESWLNTPGLKNEVDRMIDNLMATTGTNNFLAVFQAAWSAVGSAVNTYGTDDSPHDPDIQIHLSEGRISHTVLWQNLPTYPGSETGLAGDGPFKVIKPEWPTHPSQLDDPDRFDYNVTVIVRLGTALWTPRDSSYGASGYATFGELMFDIGFTITHAPGTVGVTADLTHFPNISVATPPTDYGSLVGRMVGPTDNRRDNRGEFESGSGGFVNRILQPGMITGITHNATSSQRAFDFRDGVFTHYYPTRTLMEDGQPGAGDGINTRNTNPMLSSTHGWNSAAMRILFGRGSFDDYYGQWDPGVEVPGGIPAPDTTAEWSGPVEVSPRQLPSVPPVGPYNFGIPGEYAFMNPTGNVHSIGRARPVGSLHEAAAPGSAYYNMLAQIHAWSDLAISKMTVDQPAANNWGSLWQVSEVHQSNVSSMAGAGIPQLTTSYTLPQGSRNFLTAEIVLYGIGIYRTIDTANRPHTGAGPDMNKPPELSVWASLDYNPGAGEPLVFNGDTKISEIYAHPQGRSVRHIRVNGNLIIDRPLNATDTHSFPHLDAIFVHQSSSNHGMNTGSMSGDGSLPPGAGHIIVEPGGRFMGRPSTRQSGAGAWQEQRPFEYLNGTDRNAGTFVVAAGSMRVELAGERLNISLDRQRSRNDVFWSDFYRHDNHVHLINGIFYANEIFIGHGSLAGAAPPDPFNWSTSRDFHLRSNSAFVAHERLFIQHSGNADRYHGRLVIGTPNQVPQFFSRNLMVSVDNSTHIGLMDAPANGTHGRGSKSSVMYAFVATLNAAPITHNLPFSGIAINAGDGNLEAWAASHFSGTFIVAGMGGGESDQRSLRPVNNGAAFRPVNNEQGDAVGSPFAFHFMRFITERMDAMTQERWFNPNDPRLWDWNDFKGIGGMIGGQPSDPGAWGPGGDNRLRYLAQWYRVATFGTHSDTTVCSCGAADAWAAGDPLPVTPRCFAFVYNLNYEHNHTLRYPIFEPGVVTVGSAGIPGPGSTAIEDPLYPRAGALPHVDMSNGNYMAYPADVRNQPNRWGEPVGTPVQNLAERRLSDIPVLGAGNDGGPLGRPRIVNVSFGGARNWRIRM